MHHSTLEPKKKAEMGSKASCCSVSLLLLLLLLVFSTATYGEDGEQKPSRVKSIMLSLADTAFPYSEKAKLVVKKAHSYFFRPAPNLDFRGSGTKAETETGDDERVIVASEMEKGGEEGRGGVGERVREAASKSLEKTKSTLEDSAKLAGNALHEVTDKVKTSFGHHQGEL